MRDFGLVSIITPSYNCAGFIDETINSIQAQTYGRWEMIIVDDCSSDNSCQIIEKYQSSDDRIILVKLLENSGAGIARNIAIEKAKGRFIAFCDSDDCWYPTKLEEQLEFMMQGDYCLSYTSYDICNEEGQINRSIKCSYVISWSDIIRDNGIGCLTAIYDTRKIGKQYMPTIRKRQDWGLWINIIRKYGNAYGLQRPLAVYRLRKNSISSNKLKLLTQNYKIYNQVIGYNKLLSCGALLFYFLPCNIYKKIKLRLSSNKPDV